ncbi:hypothetical protein KTD31_03140 [Burkholderia multivorans]|uniref:hypothetical protein n=1 Tax=Burkholderia multivorans TaxID=87883 RepID=UPI001C2207E8|nr:hypothetical protein [Burkholderia multivorans]MBU9200347.1 hypothetical protein [Burkholderia multivorans]MDN8078527.1 hypothetical protein [Burkholderia multivorans]
MRLVRVKVSAAIANEWLGRGINDVIPDLPQYGPTAGVLQVRTSVANEILADCEFNGDSKGGPEEMPAGTRRAYRAPAKQLRESLKDR